jgi:hypothetical protein
MLAELRHRDAAERQARRVVTQRNEFQCADGITGGERSRSRGDQ